MKPNTLALILLLFTTQGYAKDPAIVEFAKSPFYKNLADQREDARLTVENLVYQTPLSVQAQYARSQNYTDTNNLTGQDVESQDAFDTSVTYERRDSLGLTLRGGYEDNRYEEPNGLPENDSNNYFMNLRGEYSVTQGGKRSQVEINQQIQMSTSRISLYTLNDNINNQLLQYYTLFTNYLVARCQYRENTKLTQSVKSTLDKGKKLYRARQISKRDYLNYLDLFNNFQNRVQTNTQQITQFRNQLLFYLNPKEIETLEKQYRSYCNRYKNFDDTLIKYSQSFKANLPQINQYFEQTFLYLVESEKITRNTLQTKLQKMQQIPNVSPFLELQTRRPDFLDDQNYSVIGGISINWVTPSRETRANLDLFEFRDQYFPGNIQVTKANYIQRFNQALITYQTQMSVYRTQMDSLRSTNQLIEYFDAQRGIQQVNSINYSNTLLRKSDLLNSLHAIVGSVDQQNLEFQLLVDQKLIQKYP